MKAVPHSYSLSLSQVDKAVLTRGIHIMIEKGKLSVESPALMSRACDFLSRIDGCITLLVTAWDAEYILLPALEHVPVCMLEADMLSTLRKIKNHE